MLITKTIAVVLISIITAFLILTLFLFFSQYRIHDGIPVLIGDKTYELQKEFYSKSVPVDEKRIFLIGSSQIIALNTTYIDNYLSSHGGLQYRVYNLASNGDQPKERLKTLDMIIAAKPDSIIYGIASRDFQDPIITSATSKPASFLPDSEQFFHELIKSILEYLHLDLSFMESPKIVTLQDIKSLSKEKNMEPEWIPYPDTFITITKDSTTIKTDEYLKSRIPLTTQVTKISTDKNDNLIALEQIIQKFHRNNIPITLVVVPESRIYLDIMPQSYKDSFDMILNQLSNQDNTKIYKLDEKYSDLKVWMDPIHLAINNATTIYSLDVAKIILGEIP